MNDTRERELLDVIRSLLFWLDGRKLDDAEMQELVEVDITYAKKVLGPEKVTT